MARLMKLYPQLGATIPNPMTVEEIKTMVIANTKRVKALEKLVLELYERFSDRVWTPPAGVRPGP